MSRTGARTDHLTRRGALAGSNHRTAALWNRGLVLRLIRQHKALSRSQISDITGLRGSTLTYIVRELIDRGVVRTAGKLDTKGAGQKQVLLNINPALGYALGVSLRPNLAKVVLVDAAEQWVGGAQFAVDGPLEGIPAQLRDHVDRWLAAVGRPTGRLLGVGVGVPGVVDADHGQVLHSTLFNARRVPLRQLLDEQFPGVVEIDHDACFGALAEADEGAARGASHFVYFAINHNVVGGVTRLNSFGSALYLEGRVYRGAHYAAGELAAGLRPRSDLIADEPDLSTLASADAEMTPTLQILAQSAGKTLADIVNLLDVEMVVIGGNCNIANASFLRAVRMQTELMLIPVPGREIRVIPSQLGDDTVARGAAIAACRRALEGGSILTEAPTPATASEPAAADATSTTPDAPREPTRA